MRKSFYALTLIVLVISCHASKKGINSKDTITLSYIAEKPNRFEGKAVMLDVNFLGWKYAECIFPESFCNLQITRSDWVISDGKWCCFVSGSAPKGLDPASSDPVPVRLNANVKMKDSKIYLELIDVLVKQ